MSRLQHRGLSIAQLKTLLHSLKPTGTENTLSPERELVVRQRVMDSIASPLLKPISTYQEHGATVDGT